MQQNSGETWWNCSGGLFSTSNLSTPSTGAERWGSARAESSPAYGYKETSVSSKPLTFIDIFLNNSDNLIKIWWQWFLMIHTPRFVKKKVFKKWSRAKNLDKLLNYFTSTPEVSGFSHSSGIFPAAEPSDGARVARLRGNRPSPPALLPPP